MSDVASSLRSQASKCRRLARAVDDKIAQAALIELAVDLERRAATLEARAKIGLPPQR